jgi:hypothetical protein
VAKRETKVQVTITTTDSLTYKDQTVILICYKPPTLTSAVKDKVQREDIETSVAVEVVMQAEEAEAEEIEAVEAGEIDFKVWVEDQSMMGKMITLLDQSQEIPSLRRSQEITVEQLHRIRKKKSTCYCKERDRL